MDFDSTVGSLVYAFLKDKYREAANVLKNKYSVCDPPKGSPKLEAIINKDLIHFNNNSPKRKLINDSIVTNAKKLKKNESNSDSSSDDSSDSDNKSSQQTKPLNNAIKTPMIANKTSKPNAKQDSSSSDDSSDSEDDKPQKPKTPVVVNKPDEKEEENIEDINRKLYSLLKTTNIEISSDVFRYLLLL
jgi:hypothetical protein